MKTILRNQKGFTLVEVIVAMLLLSTLAVGLLRASISAHMMTPAQVDRATLMNLAQARIETLYESVRQDWWNVADTALIPGTRAGDPQNVIVGGKTFSVSYTISAVNLSGDGGGQDYRKIHVVVQ